MKFSEAGRKLLTYLLAAALIFGCVPSQNAEAASKTDVKKIVIKKGKTNVTKKTIKLAKGKLTTLKVAVTPSSAKKKVTFKTSNKKIVAVNQKGKIVAKKEGTVKITVTVLGKNGKKKTSYVKVKVTKVNVKNPGTSEDPEEDVEYPQDEYKYKEGDPLWVRICGTCIENGDSYIMFGYHIPSTDEEEAKWMEHCRWHLAKGENVRFSEISYKVYWYHCLPH